MTKDFTAQYGTGVVLADRAAYETFCAECGIATESDQTCKAFSADFSADEWAALTREQRCMWVARAARRAAIKRAPYVAQDLTALYARTDHQE